MRKHAFLHICENKGSASLFSLHRYCRFRNFRVIFISRIFNFRSVGKFLNSRASIQLIKIKQSKIGVFNICENFEFARQRIREY